MKVLFEKQINENISVLDKAWKEAETFVLIPDRGGVTADWVEERSRLLPDQYREGHFVLLTSGSTGFPKLIVGNRERSENLARLLHKVQLSEPVLETVLVLPLTYCYAFVNQWLWSRVFSRRLVQTEGFRSPDELSKKLAAAQSAMLCLVGAQLPFFRKQLCDRTFPGFIRLHFAGGPFPQDDLEFVRALFPNAGIFNNYGCAEAMPRLTIRCAEDSPVAYNVGKPLDGVRLRTGEQGRIEFLSPFGTVAQVDGDGFRAVHPDTWIPSGDLGYEGPDGCWYLQGRANEVFKRFGEKISLPQLLSSVREIWPGQGAFYRGEDRSGEQGHVLVVSPEPSDAQVRALLMMFRQKYPRTHWPLRIESTGALPLLANQKVDVLALASMEEKKLHWDQRV